MRLKRNMTKEQPMCKVTFEFNDYTQAVLIGEDIIPSQQPDLGSFQEAPKVEQKLREIQTFMLDGLQYCKAREAYWVITPQDTTKKIGRTKYYNERKKSNYVI